VDRFSFYNKGVLLLSTKEFKHARAESKLQWRQWNGRFSAAGLALLLVAELVLLVRLPAAQTAAKRSLALEQTGEPSRLYYSAGYFGIETVVSSNDANGNGVNDYTDIMEGARIDAQNHPRYEDTYWADGYPPADVGVCTDLVWRAFAHAGYALKLMVDADIAENPDEYPGLDEYGPDPNIDFRRTRNLSVFFARHAQALTLDIEDIAEWQPGDIVVFEGHVGIISDRRNAEGVPWIIHNSGQSQREQNSLRLEAQRRGLLGHYRWTVQPGSIAWQVPGAAAAQSPFQ
jgi:uncharacterized protein YijF (DUF1287 family)